MKKLKRLLLCLIMMLCLCECTKNNEEEILFEEKQEESVNNEDFFDEKEEIEESKKRFVIVKIRIRSKPSTEAEIVGYVDYGDVINVYDVTNNEGYTWCRINEDQWIADDGTWTTDISIIKYKSNNGTRIDIVQEYSPEQEREMDYLILNGNEFTYPGFVFVGWNTEPDGSGRKVYENEYIIYALDGAKTLCLYAQWQPTIKENINVKANGDINLYYGPSYKEEWIKGIIQNEDYFTIYEQVEYEGRIWNRVSRNLWFTNNDSNYEIITSLPTIDINLGSFDKPLKIINNSDNNINTDILNYEDNELVSVFRSNFDYNGKTMTTTTYEEYTWTYPGYCYGSGVRNKYDENGRIVEQIFNSSFHYSFEYNSKNKISYKLMWYDDGGSAGGYRYDYDADGKLKQTSFESSDYTYGYEFDYNGNIVFVYDYFYYRNCLESRTHYYCEMYRYDLNGRLIQTYYPQSTQAPWGICDYYYE